MHHQHEAVSLRQLSRIANVHPHSAELALAYLAKNDLVLRRRESNRILFTLNRTHPHLPQLSAIFNAATLANITEQSQHLSERASNILPFTQRAKQMIRHARGENHDT